jgi:hypothetical protein
MGKKDKEGNILYYLAHYRGYYWKKKELKNKNALLIEENNRNKMHKVELKQNLYRLLAENTVDLVCFYTI